MKLHSQNKKPVYGAYRSGEDNMVIDYIPTCHCGEADGKKVLLNTQAHVGVLTALDGDGVFVDNHGLYLENRYCPQCGAQRILRPLGEGQTKLY